MKIFYGYDDQHYINVTSTIFTKCFKNNQLVIPTGDGARCEIIGFDPYPNILKHILIIDYNGNKYKFAYNRPCVLSFEPILQQLQDMNPASWYQQEGKFIPDAVARVHALHQHLNFDHGILHDEFPEQVLAAAFVKEDAKVLEIGGNLGRNSLVLSSMLKSTDQLVVLETNLEVIPKLTQNLRQNQFQTRVEPSALSSVPLISDGWVTVPASIATEEAHKGWKPVATITFDELQTKYAIQFDTLVADCEGALYYILKENPEVLDGIQTVIMENDYWDIDIKNKLDTILRLKGLVRIHHQAGGWGPCYDFFYEVWRKQDTANN